MFYVFQSAPCPALSLKVINAPCPFLEVINAPCPFLEVNNAPCPFLEMKSKLALFSLSAGQESRIPAENHEMVLEKDASGKFLHSKTINFVPKMPFCF